MQEPDFLDIKAAAALLCVSETSLRRWTNSGSLPSFRVGGRRERRFKRSDLLAFLESHPARGPQPTSDPPAYLGHQCGFYAHNADRTRRAAAFLAEGLVSQSTCFLSATPDVRDEVLAALEERPLRIGRGARSRLLISLEYLDRAEAQLEYWEARLASAASSGALAMRVLGDVSGGLLSQGSSFQDLLRYEADFERRIARRFPAATLCLYDARKLSGVEAHELLQQHPDTLRYPDLRQDQ